MHEHNYKYSGDRSGASSPRLRPAAAAAAADLHESLNAASLRPATDAEIAHWRAEDSEWESRQKDTTAYRRQLRALDLELFEQRLASRTQQARLQTRLGVFEERRAHDLAAERERGSAETYALLTSVDRLRRHVSQQRRWAVEMHVARQTAERERQDCDAARTRLCSLLSL